MVVGEFEDIGRSGARPKRGDPSKALAPDGDWKATPSAHCDVSLPGRLGGSTFDGDEPPIPV
jgi:hypothetical protein